MRNARALLECTYVFVQPWKHAGVQRVVRNIAKQTHARGETTLNEAVLVALSGEACFVPDTLLHEERSFFRHQISRLFAWLIRARAAVERKLEQGLDPGTRKSFAAQKYIGLPLCWGASFCLGSLRTVGFDPYTTRAKRFEPRAGDILVLLDSSWHDPRFFKQVRALKDRGVSVVSVVYDLIPILHSEYCDKNLTPVFSRWLDEMIAVADGFVCISQWTCDEVRQEVIRRVGEEAAGRKFYASFQLGSELDMRKDKAEPSPRVAECFAGDDPVFLTVGTIEPRKNHALILEAFERHWANGGQAKLCVIGRPGWMCRDIMQRLKNHREAGWRLFVFHDADDDDLEFAYRHAAALVAASFVEGFGLPLVEALERGLRPLASDIPVFHEVVGEFAVYFDPHDAHTLQKIIDDFAATGTLPSARPITEWRGVTWRESAQQLFAAAQRCVNESKTPKAATHAHQY
jgi:glycosyltransferase involved in cell wall biosynthesis